jgi:UDP-N-acetylmuramate dehydrogenase
VALFVMGGGSNLLISDAGFDGLVLRVGLKGIEESSSPDHPEQKIFKVAAGEDWDEFVDCAVDADCAGIECLAGIPGTVGGTPVQNVGAYGQEVASAIERVRAFDLEQREFVELAADECGFAYRRSRFNSTDRDRYIVTRVDYRLTVGGAPTVQYAELQKVLHQSQQEGREFGLAEVSAVVRHLRLTKGMLMVEGDADCRSAGSFFKNPLIAEEKAKQIAAGSEKELPRYAAGAGQVKVPAAWLIEQAGFAKGYALGRAGISSRHTLALVNRGGATATEVLALAEQITGAVEARFGVKLEMEPVRVGF